MKSEYLIIPARAKTRLSTPPARADRKGILEPHPAALGQPDAETTTIAGELQLNFMVPGSRSRAQRVALGGHDRGRGEPAQGRGADR